jgi:hypothetical protein
MVQTSEIQRWQIYRFNYIRGFYYQKKKKIPQSLRGFKSPLIRRYIDFRTIKIRRRNISLSSGIQNPYTSSHEGTRYYGQGVSTGIKSAIFVWHCENSIYKYKLSSCIQNPYTSYHQRRHPVLKGHV